MEFKTRLSQKVIVKPLVMIEANGVEIPAGDDFDEWVEELCGVDGFFALRGVTTHPTVSAMMKAGLVNHSQGRGCYASQLLRDNKEAILKAYSDAVFTKKGKYRKEYMAMWELKK